MSLRVTVASLTEEIRFLKKVVSNITNERDKVLEKLILVRDELIEKSEEANDLSRESEGVKREVVGLKDQLDLTNKERESLKQEIRDLKYRHDTLIDKLLSRVNIEG
ncbi:MAG TPA: hypothetical protein VI978_00230 [Candidatus Paceibacterota bacterium]